MKIPCVGLQHTKAGMRDHGLNRAGDAIVIGLPGASETASGGIRQADVEVQRTPATLQPAIRPKMSSCFAAGPTGSI